MEQGHYIEAIEILNYADPVVSRRFHLTPANGEAYLSTQVRMSEGDRLSRSWSTVASMASGG
jgi:predicted secreted protein